MNWDDLRVAMAVHRSGSYAKAGAQLNVDETTIARRLTRLQKDLGVQLFEAVDGERRPTRRCEEILGHVEQMARHVGQIVDAAEAQNGPVGRYRIAATDSVSCGVLAPNAAGFLAQHPGLTLQFLASTENVNFSRWEADIAVRLGKPEKGDFIISKLGAFGFYLFEPKKPPAQGADPLICAYPEDLDSSPESQFMIATGRQAKARCISKNLLVTQALIRSGTCSGVLPTFLCDGLLDDKRLRATRLDHTREAWLLVQQHLKQDSGARAIIAWLRACFAAVGK